MRTIVAATLFLLAFPGFAAPSVADLGFMTGSWTGALGPNTLEETWNEPQAGTVAAVIRVSGLEGTAFIEFIIINEEEDTLVLRVQQFTPNYEPVAPANRMTMKELTDRSITFVSETGDIRELTYTRTDDTTFTVQATTAGGELNALLHAVE